MQTSSSAVAAAAPASAPAFTTPVAVTSVDAAGYQDQLKDKLNKLQELFAEFTPPPVEVFESPPSHYRMRAEFTVEQRDGDFHYVMFDRAADSSDADEGGAGAEEEAAEPAGGAAAGGSGSGAAADGADGPREASGAAASSSAGPAQAAGKAGGKGGKGLKRKQQGPRRVRVDTFPVASRQVNELMDCVRAEVGACPELRQRLFQVNFHTTLAGDAMVTLLYHRKLGPAWEEAARKLRDTLAATPTAAAAGTRPHVIGRSRKQKVTLDADYVIEKLRVNGVTYTQKQVEGSFSQPNGAVCQHMLTWAQDVTRPAEGAAAAGAEGQEGQAAEAGGGAAAGGPGTDLLELYCGNGNFTIPLSRNFRQVVATEVAKSSVDAARFNLEANGVSNVFLARMASEEFAVTMRERGSRRRLAELTPWEQLRLRTVLVDPPRAGLDDFTVELLKEFERIVYISCNPETLAANLRALAPSHSIARFAAFDQFPYTHHLECGVYLVRREGWQPPAAPAPAPAAAAAAVTEAAAGEGQQA